MKLQVWRSTVPMLGVLVAALCVMWGCSTPTKVGIKAKAPGIEIEVEYDSAGNPITNAQGSLAPGKCLRITYKGANSAQLGQAVITVPGSFPIPAGAVEQVFEIVDCPEPPTLTGPSAQLLDSYRSHALPVWREVYTMPITLASSTGEFQRGVICHARVRCLPTQDPVQLLQPVLLAGPGVAVPATIDVLFMAEVTPIKTGARIRVAARSPILDMNLEWNDIQNFADLASGINAGASTLSNGWQAVDSTVPASAFRQGIGDWNGGRIKIRTLAHPAFSEYQQSFQTLAL